MNLRPIMSSRRPPPRWRLALLTALAVALLSLGGVPGRADAGVSYYGSPLYLSSALSSSSVLGSGSYQLVTAQPGSASPATQNRIALNTTGYQDFWPGYKPTLSTQNTPSAVAPEPTSAPTTPDNKGWVVDGSGAVSFAPGWWTFEANVKENSSTGEAATLAVGMWKVTVSGGTIQTWTLLVDPNCSTAGSCALGAAPGDAILPTPGTNFIVTGSGLALVQLPVDLSGFSLANGEHLYVQYWRHQTVAFTGTASYTSRTATLYVNDGTAQITHPAVTALPNLHVTTPPSDGTAYKASTLPASLAGDSSDAADGVASVAVAIQDGSGNYWGGSAFDQSSQTFNATGGTTANWTYSTSTLAGQLSDGHTYTITAKATDTAGNATTTTRTFVYDTTGPTAHVTTPAADGTFYRAATLPGNLAGDSSDATSGVASVQIAIQDGSGNYWDGSDFTQASQTFNATGGSTGSWTYSTSTLAGQLSDGHTYTITAKGTDNAGNVSTTTRTFVYDTTGPTLHVTMPAADGTFYRAATLPGNLAGDSSDATSGVASVQIAIQNGSGNYWGGSAFDQSSQTFNATGGSTGSWTYSTTTLAGKLSDGHTYTITAKATDTAGNATTTTRTFVYDTTAPTVSGLSASNGDGSYKADTTIHIQVSFSEPVTVTGSPKLALNTTPAESATYAGGAPGSTLTFDYTVQAGDNVATLDYTGAGALTLNGGTIADLATNNATLTLASPGAAGSLAANKSIAIDTVAPTAGGVTASNVNGSYKAGQTIHVQVGFSEPVNVTGSPKLALNTTPAESATYASGSGSSTLIFDYTVQAGDNVATLGYNDTGVLTLNGGTIADPAGNNATLTLALPGAAGSLSANKSIRIDTNPPGTPSLDGPADASYLGAAPALSATFSNSDAGDSGSLDFQVCADAACSSVVQSGSSASGLADGASGSWTPSGFADGVYYWHARGTDAVGNQSGWSAVRSFTLDTTAPTAPALGSIATRVNTTPQLSATFSDPGATDSGTLSFELCSNGSCATVLQSNTTGAIANGANGNWTPSSLADGNYYWRVRARDSAGNLSGWSAASSFVVDTVPPGAPAFVSPAAAARVKSPQLGATFVDSDASDSGTVSFELCSDAACSTVVGSSTSATVSGGTAVSWTPGGLSDGTYYWRLRATDAAGNQTGWTASRSFVLDTNPPATPTLAGPADAAYLGAAPALSATFASSDVGDSGTLDFQVCSDSGCGSVVKSGSSASGLASGVSGSWTPGGLADGTYYWRASATDAAGNQSGWSAARSFTLDTTPPSVPVETAPGDDVRLNQPSSLNATYADAGGDAGSVIFQVCTTSACTTVAASTTVTGMLNNAGAGWTPGSLSDGTYYWRARAEDSGGNLSAWSAARSFTIDSTPPVAPALVGFAGVHVRTAPALTALVDDPGDPADKVRLLVELCTDPACTQVVTTGYSGSVPGGTLAGWQAPELPDGPYYWRARAEDIVGNQSLWSAVDSFVVDTRAPAVPAAAGPAVGAIVNTARLSAAVTGLSRGGGSGLEFQVCADAACAKVVASGYVPVPASGAAPAWTPTGLRDGSYFWRLSAHDQAGNESAWSETMSFVLDQTPPGKPRGLKANVRGRTLTLRWKAPARAAHLAGYVLLVNGRRIRVVTAKTHSVHITLKKGDARLFAVAAFDAAGNVGRPATVVGPDLIRLTLKQARGAASPKPPVQSHRS
jgi:hypothetical protein